jgi:hypothetical protein
MHVTAERCLERTLAGETRDGDHPIMHTIVLLAASVLGLDYGWQPLTGGGFEYIIQIEPELLDSLQAGETLRSDLPPYLRDVRSYRIQVGRGPVPRLGNPQAAVAETPASEPPQTPEPARQEPISAPRDRWTPYGEPAQEPPTRTPRDNLRYPDYRTETPKPKLPSQEPALPKPIDDDTPGRFQPDPATTAMVQQTSAYGAGDTKTTEAKAAAGPSGSKPPIAEAASKPWLPLTFTLLGLFVSLGGNAYLGLQWWTIRQRCQQLLRDRRVGRPNSAERLEADTSGLRLDARNLQEADDEDQDVRAISEEELPRGKRRRSGA